MVWVDLEGSAVILLGGLQQLAVVGLGGEALVADGEAVAGVGVVRVVLQGLVVVDDRALVLALGADVVAVGVVLVGDGLADLLVLLRLIEGLYGSATPYELIAGDLNGDDSLNLPDALLLMNMIGY